MVFKWLHFLYETISWEFFTTTFLLACFSITSRKNVFHCTIHGCVCLLLASIKFGCRWISNFIHVIYLLIRLNFFYMFFFVFLQFGIVVHEIKNCCNIFRFLLFLTTKQRHEINGRMKRNYFFSIHSPSTYGKHIAIEPEFFCSKYR